MIRRLSLARWKASKERFHEAERGVMFRRVGEPRRISRAGFLRFAVGGLLATSFRSEALAQVTGKMLTRPIPSSGEGLPVVGLGTWRTFDVGTSVQERAPLRQVLSILF